MYSFRRWKWKIRVCFIGCILLTTCVLFIDFTRVIKEVSPRSMVIVLAYWRSGSTLTADVIQQNPNVFYVYEPLHFLFDMEKKQEKMAFPNNQFKIPDITSRVQTLKSYLTCDLDNIDLSTLTQKELRSTRTTNTFHICLWKYKVYKHEKQYMIASVVRNCLPLLFERCKDTKITSIKTIRMPMESMSSLLNEYPQLKIVHLIRDPRAMLLSRYNTNRKNYILENFIKSAEEHCARISKDLQDSRTISLRNPNRIFTVRYEDLAEEPITVFKEIFDFLDMKFTKNIKKYVYDITQRGRQDNGIYGTARANSVKTAYKWRQVLSFKNVSYIDAVCSELYNTMGYLPVPDSRTLTDMSFSLKRNLR